MRPGQSDIYFRSMHENAMSGKTKTSFFARGNHIDEMKRKFKQLETGVFDVSVHKNELPYSIEVSWEHTVTELRTKCLNYIESKKGPHNLVSVVGYIRPWARSSYRNELIHIFAKNLTHELCKIRIEVPNGCVPMDIIKEIDDCESFTYYECNTEHDGHWHRDGKWGNNFYISNKKVAFMLRVSHGWEFSDLTES